MSNATRSSARQTPWRGPSFTRGGVGIGVLLAALWCFGRWRIWIIERRPCWQSRLPSFIIFFGTKRYVGRSGGVACIALAAEVPQIQRDERAARLLGTSC